MKAEVKVWASAMGTLFIGVLLAVLNAVLADSTILGSLPSALQTLILVVIPPIISFLSGYYKRSNTSTTSDGYNGN
jgi:hypothetical protein